MQDARLEPGCYSGVFTVTAVPGCEGGFLTFERPDETAVTFGSTESPGPGVAAGKPVATIGTPEDPTIGHLFLPTSTAVSTEPQTQITGRIALSRSFRRATQ